MPTSRWRSTGAKGVLAVPIQAIDRAEDKTTVLVVAHDAIERRDVTTGLETPDRVEIARGVAEGDLVVVGNRTQLRPGHGGRAQGGADRRRLVRRKGRR